MHISLQDALKKLQSSKEVFKNFYEHGSLSIELYQPDKIDHQQPHDRDEVYIITSGSGIFYNDGKSVEFNKGDFLFVPAFKEHRFESFTDDFSTWVIFYGPVGGE